MAERFYVAVNGRHNPGCRYTSGAAAVEARNIRAQFPKVTVEVIPA